MVDDIYKNLSKQHSTGSGRIAVDKATVTENQLKKVVAKQDEDNLSCKPCGQDDYINNAKIDIDLNIMFKKSE